MLRLRRIFSLGISCVLAGSFAQAQQLKTVNGIFPLKHVGSKGDIAGFITTHNSVSAKVGQGAKDYVVLSFDHILTDAERKQVESTGFDLVGWLPENAYIAATNNAAQSLNALNSPLPNGVGEVPLALKLSKELYQYVNSGNDVPKHAIKSGVTVTVQQKGDISALKEILNAKSIPFSIEKYCGDNALVIRKSDWTTISEIAALSYVASVEPYAGESNPEWAFKMFANGTLAANYDLNGPIGNNTFFGNYETYGDFPEFDFNMTGRQHPTYSDNSNNGHGTNCAEIVGAANNRDEYEDRGMAPGVTSLYVGWYNTAENYYVNQNIKPLTSNHSVGWGAGQVTYNNDAREIDRIGRQLGGYLHSYSAGNSGDSGPFNGYPAGWANLTGNIKVNKNHFTTHSAAAPGSHHTWTNNGPAADGRLKPDICAEGGEGSSYASPGVMGLANMLYESYTNTYGTFPRSDVVKAVILNTANDLDKKGIDFKTGFGVINPARANRSITQQNIITGSMPSGNGGLATYNINIPAGQREARIMLYWHDYQGTVGAIKALVNNLDIEVIDPLGNTILPWVLKPTPAAVYDLPTQQVDTLNNVEQVRIDNPMAGSYTIRVKGTLVPQGPQAFVVTHDVLPYHIEITSPVANFRTGRGKSIYFTWNLANNQTVAADSIQVFLQRISTEGFTQIASLPNSGLYYNYTVPNTFPLSSTARVIVRQKNTTLVDTSDFFHVMLTPDSLGFTRICTDTIALRWDTVANTGGKYIIYRLGNKYMYPIDSVAHPATTRTISAEAVLGVGQQWAATEWFAIAARQANGALSLRSLPITQDPTNPLNAPTWEQDLNYTLCFGDTAKLSAGWMAGDSVRWFKDNVLIAGGTTPVWPVTVTDPGVYHVKVYSSACIYTGPDITVDAGLADINDTTLWGNYKWQISAYQGDGYATAPYYGPTPNYYGKFFVNDLSFNSNDYYAWSGSGPHNAPGYVGCDFTAANTTTTVWKRKGFVPGNYQFNILRASGKMRITVDNGIAVTAYISPTNAFTVNNVWNGYLDSNSTVRVEHYGSHARLDIIPLTSIAPGAVSTGLSVWNKADMSHGDINGRHTLVNVVPNGGAAEKSTGSTIAYFQNGRNFNPVLEFDNSGGFKGRFPGIASAIYDGEEVTTLGIFKISSNFSDAEGRMMTFAGDNTVDNNTDESVIPFSRDNNSVRLFRDGNSFTGPNLGTDKWLHMTSRFDAGDAIVSQKGALESSTPYTPVAFNLKRYAVGGFLDQNTGGNMTGNMAELIHYNRTLTTAEENKVNTYLAIKYGTTLAHEYYNTQGQVVYDMTSFPLNVAGIAREGLEGLMQKQSRSTEDVADVFTGSLGAIAATNNANTNGFSADTVYAVWGNNGTDTTFNSVLTTNNHERMDRIWKLQKSGSVGTLRCNFNLLAVPVSNVNACTQYFLAWSDDTTFTSGVTTFTPMVSYTGGDNVEYAYAELDLNAMGNSTTYFTVTRMESEVKALAAGSQVNTLLTCEDANSISIKDNADDKIVARITMNTGTDLPVINSVSYATDYTDAQLVNCNTASTISLLNRILQIDATLQAGNTVNLRMYMLAADSLNAATNPVLVTNSCQPLNFDVKWYKEPTTADVFTKLANLQGMSEYADIVYGVEDGIDYVEYQNVNSFSSFGGVLDNITTGVATAAKTNMQVYPNPVEDKLFIDYTADAEGRMGIVLYDALGKVVYREDRGMHSGFNRVTINMGAYAAGAYTININSDKETKVMKVTKVGR